MSARSGGRVRPQQRGVDPKGKKKGLDRGVRLTVSIESLVGGGRGLARLPDGRVAFVSGTCPGDEVEIEVRGGGSKCDAELVSVSKPSALRVAPPCSWAQSCGGCDWMHIATEQQPHLHARLVVELLSHAVKDSVPHEGAGVGAERLPAPTVHAAPRGLRYRTRARLHVKADRRGVSLGYLAPRSHDIVEIGSCLVLDPRLDEALPLLRELFAGAHGQGEVELALGRDQKPVLEVSFRGDFAATTYADLDRLTTGASARLAGARVALDGAQRAATFGDPSPVQTRPDGNAVVLSPGGFGQPSDEGAALLADIVRRRVSPEGKHVVELFAGSGTLSVGLAAGAASYVGVEIEEAASKAARENLTSRGLVAKLVAADADAFEIPKKADVVVLDPPRTGARGAVQAIVAARTKQVVYVSCDPATLARDVRALTGGGYDIQSIDTVELFPQTSHVETVVVLGRARPERRGPPS